MDPHRQMADTAAAELATRADVLAVLVTGSVCRGEHMPTSDVDLLVVTTGNHSLQPARVVRDGLLVEWGAKTEHEWRERFDRPKTSWLYAFLEADVAYDTGAAARLIAAAQATLSRYTTPPQLKNELAIRLWHGQAKLDRAIANDDPHEQGFWASVVTPSLLDALYAARDVPLPAGSRRLAYLRLVPLSDTEQDQIAGLLTGSADERLRAALTLAAAVRAELGEPDLEAL